MQITGMNHFNVLTNDVDATRRFYVDVLGLVEGPRPPFKFPGLWLYAGGQPILHISGGDIPASRAGVIDHIAFSTTGLKQTVDRLNANGIQHSLYRQVGTGIWQIFCHDPMGAKVELDFDPAEAAP
jgi:catechol 2,3-dioxygenase-like lactoylglutathione lyase family enzyme